MRIRYKVMVFFGFIMILNGLKSGFERSIWSVRYIKNQSGSIDSLSQDLEKPLGNHPRSRIWLAREALKNNDYNKARSLIHPLTGTGNKEALRLLGRILWSQSNYEEAVQIWKSQGDYTILQQQANQILIEGNLSAAKLAYKAAYEIDPQNGTLPLVNFYWLQLGDVQNAEHYLLRSIVMYPSSPHFVSWLTRLGDVLKSQGEWDQAEKYYQRSLHIQETSQAHIGLGWIYYSRDENIDAALDSFNAAIELDENKGEGYFAVGELFMSEDQYERAEKWFLKAIEVNPEQPWYYIERANAVRSDKDYSKAIDLFKSAINRFSDFAPLYYELAWAYRLDNKPDKAIIAMEQALNKMSMPNVQYYLRAGVLYEWINNDDKALEMYRHALRVSPGNNDAQQNIDRLEKEENIAP